MIVKRYDFDCYAFYDSARLSVNECEDGDYVLYSDYAALLARHNALVEAVAWMLECDACPLKNTTEAEKHGFSAIWATRRAARAEVDRLLQENN
jgi:hypothetical protein